MVISVASAANVVISFREKWLDFELVKVFFFANAILLLEANAATEFLDGCTLNASALLLSARAANTAEDKNFIMNKFDWGIIVGRRLLLIVFIKMTTASKAQLKVIVFARKMEEKTL